MEDLLTDILSKSAADPGSDPGGGGGKGSGTPPATNTRAAASATGFATGWVMGIGALAMLACTSGATACVASGAGANGAVMEVEARSMEEVGPLMKWGSLGEVEESLTVEGIG